MQLKVEQVTKEPREYKGVKSWGVKMGNDWYDLKQDAKPNKGDVVEVEVKQREANGRTYRDAYPVKAAATSNGHGGHAVKWEDYQTMADFAHVMASRLEPDSADARAAILNTVMIAFTNGKIQLPEDGPPPLSDEDAPPWERS